MSSLSEIIDRRFALHAQRTTVRREIRAGCATFLTMSYILFVNPQILGAAIRVENTFPQLLTATALAAALGTLLMGVYARYPFALAPGMGINAYFAYEVCGRLGIAWQAALGAVFLSGLLFLALSVAGIREWIINAVPAGLKIAVSCGIGLFLAVIGCKNGGLIAAHPATLVTLGDLAQPAALLAVFGLLLTSILLALRVSGAILVGILMTTILAIGTGARVYPGAEGLTAFAGVGSLVQAPVWPREIFLQLDLRQTLSLGLWSIVFIFLFVDLFDTAGTLIGLSEKAGYLDAEGRLPRAGRAFSCDALATCAGALLGTSTTTSYIESAAGIEEGGRTGLTAVTVAALFLLSLFCWPLAAAVPAAATAPALILIGAMMMVNVGKIDWPNYRAAIPAFLTIIAMPLTYSIANGISFGIISSSALHLLSGKPRGVHWLLHVLAALLILRYVFLAGRV